MADNGRLAGKVVIVTGEGKVLAVPLPKGAPQQARKS